MKTLSLFKIAVNSLRTHKTRSGLTILGIIIGIVAIILVMSVGSGAQSLIISEVQGLGSKTMIVIPGREPKGPNDASLISTALSDSLRDRELDALRKKSNAPHIEKVIPVVFGVESASYRGETYRPAIIGGGYGILEVFNIEPAQGRGFTEEEVKSNANVALISTRVKDELFGSSDAIGETIKIKNKTFRIIGVLPKLGQIYLFDFNDIILTPISTAQFYLFGIKYYNNFIIEARTEEQIPNAVDDIKITLRNLHNISGDQRDDFYVWLRSDMVRSITTITDVLKLLLVSIAAISLVVGGIGIMNIMLVSVTERTKEIGLRKAVGATRDDIMNQFLVETIILTLVGGIIGIAIGFTLNYIGSVIIREVIGLHWPHTSPISAAIMGLSVSIVVGFIFGLYPASMAAKKSPIEALRYE